MATTTSKSQPITDTLEEIGIVDCDAHFTEPSSLWLDRAPASMSGRVPVQKTVDGITAWHLDGEVWASTGGNTIKTGREKILGSHVIQPFESVDHAAWDVPERLGLLDDMGVDAQIIYPNGIGFASNHIFAIEDMEQRTAILKMYNDFFVDVQDESNNRLFPQALLPIWDMDLTIAEMKRLLDKGIRGFTLSDKPEMLGLPELPESYFDPMWDLFNESGAVANFHIGAGARREELEGMRNMRNQPEEVITGPRPIPSGGQHLLAQLRSSTPACRARDPDVHEQRAHHRQPVYERSLRPFSQPQDRLRGERHRMGALHPRIAGIPDR